MSIHPQTLRGRPGRSLAALLVAAAGGTAWADEPSPYYIGASEGITHDSNVFRTSAPISDTYSTTSLLGGFDQSIGRQHFFGSANVGLNKYRSQGNLDNTSYGVNAGWDWQTINELSGGLSASANQSLATQNGNQPVFDANGNPIAPTSTRNLVRTDQLGASVRWGGSGPLSLSSAYSHSRVNYSNTQTSESSGDSASINANYRVGPTVTAGVGLRYTRSRTPYGVALVPNPTNQDDYSANSSNSKNLDLTLDWRLSAQTGVNARLSFTRQSNSTSGAQDFSGLTGGFSASYAPTAKLNFGASYSRDTGSNGAFFNVAPTTTTDTGTGTTTTTAAAIALSQNTTVSDSLGLNAGYALTSKISTTAGVQYRRSRNNTTLSDSGTEYVDSLRSATLGFGYAAGRVWSLGCNLSHEWRSVGNTTGFSYTDNTVGCTVQATLR